MDPFDTESLRADMASTLNKEQECVTWCQQALEGFEPAARRVGTPIASLEVGSLAWIASGIAKAPWTQVTTAGKSYAQYFVLLKNNRFAEVWAAADGEGVTLDLAGHWFCKGASATTAETAAFVAKVTGYDLGQCKELFNAALKGQPYAFG